MAAFHRGRDPLLVLTRKVGEAVAVGDDVKIVVMQIKGKQVRLGIKASPTTVVHREEIYQKIKQENVDASQAQVGSLEQASDLFKKAEQAEVKPQRSSLRRVVRPGNDS